MPDFLKNFPTSLKILLTCLVAGLSLAGVLNFENLKSFSSFNGNEKQDESIDKIKVKFNIYDRDNNPLNQVSVQFIFDGAPASRVTDSNGYVSIEIPKRDEVEVVFSKDGFQSLRQSINTNADTNKTVTFYLDEITTDNLPDRSLTPQTPQATTTSAPAQTLEPKEAVGLRHDMKYEIARSLLIEQGWQPRTPTSNGDFPPYEYFTEKGWLEVVACSGTGRGFCRFEFYNTKGDTLVVVTVRNSERFGGSRVERWVVLAPGETSSSVYGN